MKSKVNYIAGQTLRFQVLNPGQCNEIKNASFRILERTGCEIHHQEALKLLSDAGCRIDGKRVRIPSYLLEKAIRTAPSRISIYDRFGKSAMNLEPYKSYFGPSISNISVIDLATGKKRKAVKNDVVDCALTCESLSNIDFVQGMACITDCTPELQDLHEAHALLQNTTKPIAAQAANDEVCQDIIDMASTIVGGFDKLVEKPYLMFGCSPTSPLAHPESAMNRLLYVTSKRLPMFYNAAIMLGGTGPVTIAGALSISLADILVGLLVSQLNNEGTPFICGLMTDILDMGTMAFCHTGPEFTLASAAATDLMRYLDLPSSQHFGSTDAPVFDQQAAFDISTQLSMACLSGGNLNMFIGYLEAAMSASLACLVFADEALDYNRRLLRGVDVSLETLAEDTTDNVGPCGNYLGEQHTFDHFKEIWKPGIFSRKTYEQWEESGSKDLNDRCTDKVEDIIARGPKNPLKQEVQDKLDAIVNKAERRIG